MLDDKQIEHIVSLLSKYYEDADICMLSGSEIKEMVLSSCEITISEDDVLRITNIWLKKTSGSDAEYDRRWDASL